MNVKRFVARTTRNALVLVRQTFGDEAVILSTRPCSEGVEVLAMEPAGMAAIEQFAGQALPGVLPSHAPTSTRAAAAAPAPAPSAAPAEPSLAARPAGSDAEQLAMSTLSFQDYVRERMLKRRQAALHPEREVAEPAAAAPGLQMSAGLARLVEQHAAERSAQRRTAEPRAARSAATLPTGRGGLNDAPAPVPRAEEARSQRAMLEELREVKGLIEQRFGALAFMDQMRRNPEQARLTQRLLECGFSAALVRKLATHAPADQADLDTWAASVLERNLLTNEGEAPLEEQGGVWAMVGSTGVGKTTSTAKLAAAFAARHGAASLGLITLDAYRVGAHEQLRAYGRILGVAVHTAHDRPALEDLLDLLSTKKMVLIDTAGVAQRDSRTEELLDMVAHPAIQRLLVVNASSQGETLEDVIQSYRASECAGVVLSKIDEAVQLAPALDAVIRHRLKVVGVANGQRVPEDWHRMSAQALLHRALRSPASRPFRMDTEEVKLVFATPPHSVPSAHAVRAASSAAGGLHA